MAITKGEARAMPVLWTAFHSTREVVISVDGVVHLKEMEECVEGALTPANRSYRKLVDLSKGRLALSRADIEALATYVRKLAGTGPMGALAITVGSAESEQQAQHFHSLSAADRPLKIFRDLQAARLWLNAQPSRALPLWLEEPMLPPPADDAPLDP
jgi:hypothetical protein